MILDLITYHPSFTGHWWVLVDCGSYRAQIALYHWWVLVHKTVGEATVKKNLYLSSRILFQGSSFNSILTKG
jgi:hypothetical protein